MQSFGLLAIQKLCVSFWKVSNASRTDTRSVDGGCLRTIEAACIPEAFCQLLEGEQREPDGHAKRGRRLPLYH